MTLPLMQFFKADVKTPLTLDGCVETRAREGESCRTFTGTQTDEIKLRQAQAKYWTTYSAGDAF